MVDYLCCSYYCIFLFAICRKHTENMTAVCVCVCEHSLIDIEHYSALILYVVLTLLLMLDLTVVPIWVHFNLSNRNGKEREGSQGSLFHWRYSKHDVNRLHTSLSVCTSLIHRDMEQESMTKYTSLFWWLFLRQHSSDGVQTDGELRKNPSSLNSSNTKTWASVCVCQWDFTCDWNFQACNHRLVMMNRPRYI